MRFIRLWVIAFAGLLPIANERSAHAESGLTSRQARIAAAIVSSMKRYGIPGVSVAIVESYRIDYAQGFGKRALATGQQVTAKTLFQAASLSKPVTAAAALLLVGKGKLQLDADVNAVLTSWKVRKQRNGPAVPVTLRQLLSHSAGLTVHGFGGYPYGAQLPTGLSPKGVTPQSL